MDKPGKAKPVVGREIVLQAQEEIGSRIIRRFARTIGEPDARYYEPGRGEVLTAPPTMIFEAGFDVGEGTDPATGMQLALQDYLGYPPNIQRTGNEYEMLEPVRADDIVTAKRKIVEVTEKEGKTGRWAFVTSVITYTNQHGKVLARNKEMLACRD